MNVKGSTEEGVLVVTGGLITSQERSLFQAGRKLIEQLSRARHAWLDLKVKLTFAEPLLARTFEMLQLPLRSRRMRRTVRRCFRDGGEPEPPSLTEVVLTTLLERAGVLHRCLTLDSLFASPRHAEQLLERTGCVFVSTTYLHDLSELLAVVARLKRPHNRIVVGGALAGILAEQWDGEPEVDVVAVGYGEMLVAPLLEWMRSGYRHLSPPERGRLVKKKHSLFLHSGVPETESLDHVAVPDWSLAERRQGRRFKMIYYESVRGCPYRCSFCNYPYLFDDTAFRYKSARKMADDWEHHVNDLGVESITCLDSLFTIPRDRLREFCRLLIRRRIPVKWICYARADDLADEGTVALMKAAGAHQVQVGIESGDPQILSNMNKACTVESNRRALVNCRKHGLTSAVSLIVGFPGETEASLERTYRFLEESPADFYFLATFSTRVAGVPILAPEARRRFGLEVMENFFSMAPYWRHDTLSSTEVGDLVRRLDRRIMENRISLNATLFYRGMLNYAPEDRDVLLDFQQRVAERHGAVRFIFDLVNRWVDRRLRRDVEEVFGGRRGDAARERVDPSWRTP